MGNAIRSRNTKYLFSNQITEQDSEYLRIYKQQHHEDYDVVKKNYLNASNGYRDYEAVAYGFNAREILKKHDI